MWLESGSLGAIVCGLPRLGKTFGTRWVLKMLPQLIGNFPWFEIPIRSQRIATEREFFQHILRCVGHKYYLQGTAGDKRDRLTEWLDIRAARSPNNCVVLFIDEAHLCTIKQFEWLLNICNELDARGRRLFCLLVGQTELIELKRDLINRGKQQIVGRFMVRELMFNGICSEEELKECLLQYDNTIYPPNSDTLFLENYLPIAVSHGFKLTGIAPSLWRAFENAWHMSNMATEVNIPMHYVCSAMMNIINKAPDVADLNISSKLINQCVNESGFSESLISMRDCIND